MIKLFTHNDLDGHGSSVIARTLFKDSVGICFCEVDNSDKYIQDFFNAGYAENFERIYIADIPVNEETAKLIDDAMLSNSNIVVRHFDHHETALWINKYSWAKTIVQDDKGLCSGTSLFYEYMKSVTEVEEMYPTLKDFVELVRRWDTWEWKNIYDDLTAKQLNDLFHVYGPYKFDDIMAKNMSAGQPPIAEMDAFIIKLEEDRNNKYMENKAKEVVKREFRGLTIGVVFADRCISELGNLVCEQNPDVDVAVLIDPSRSISFRTLKDLSCSEIAKSFGGGGHKYAAGCPVPKGLGDIIIDLIFKYRA